MKVSTDIKLSTKDAKENFLKLIQQKLLSKEQLVAKRSALTKELKRLSNIKSSGVAHLPDTIIFSYEDKIYTLVHNKDHFNVSMLFFEDIRRNSAKDYIDIIPGIVSSYPNLFMTLDKESLEQLSSKLSQSKSASDVWSILKTHGLSRSSKDFWKKYKYFSDNNYEDSTNEYGYLDLNRYLNI